MKTSRRYELTNLPVQSACSSPQVKYHISEVRNFASKRLLSNISDHGSHEGDESRAGQEGHEGPSGHEDHESHENQESHEGHEESDRESPHEEGHEVSDEELCGGLAEWQEGRMQ